MEEDLKTINNFINASILYSDKIGITTSQHNKLRNTLENILNELDRLQKENKELKNKKYMMSISCDGDCHICEHFKNEYLLEQEIRTIKDKAECMDYYTLVDVIDDLEKVLNEGE